MKHLLAFSLLLISLLVKASSPALKYVDSLTKAMDFSLVQYSHMIATVSDSTRFPRKTDVDTNLKTVSASDWTSGFYPGVLWNLYEYSGDTKWLRVARRWTNSLQSQQYNTGSHDVGFIINCSYGNGYRLTRKKTYPAIIRQAGYSLGSRYSSIVGCTRSWSHGTWQFPVIIDNMMNLEVFFRAYDFSMDTNFIAMAKSHSNHTISNHIRPDSTTYHVVDYNKTTGDVIWRGTKQGYSDSSCWSRGQAWGIYGFTMLFRETGDTAYLNAAKQLAGYFISNLPSDFVPYYDFDAPNIPNEFRDASAAAITSSGILELYKLTNDTFYLRTAEKILTSLASFAYTSKEGKNANFVLAHSTGGLNYEEDLSMIYADYYYIEALLRYLKFDTAFTTPNHIPELLTLQLTNGIKDSAYESLVETFDYDGDSISITASGLPSGLSMDSTGLISGTPDTIGTFIVSVDFSDGIKDSTHLLKLVIDQPTFQKNIVFPEENILAYPNPASNIIRFNKIADHAELMDLNGTLLRSTQKTQHLYIEGIAPGIYILRINHHQVFKMIIQ